jgi:hypothetical protein
MNHSEFLEALESCTLPTDAFNHRSHVRAAWLYLEQFPLPEAASRCAETIRRYAENAGATTKFHVTLTLAFMHIIAELRDKYAGCDWNGFSERCPELFENPKALLARHYREDILFSEAARTAFIEPDLAPLPRMPG